MRKFHLAQTFPVTETAEDIVQIAKPSPSPLIVIQIAKPFQPMPIITDSIHYKENVKFLKRRSLRALAKRLNIDVIQAEFLDKLWTSLKQL